MKLQEFKRSQLRTQTVLQSVRPRNAEVSLLLNLKRTYSEVVWELLEEKFTPVVLKHSKLQVIYPPQITEMTVNGYRVNGVHTVNQDQVVNITCSYINGNPPVIIRMANSSGHTLGSTKHGEKPVSTKHGKGSLTMSFRKVHCNEVWPTIRCEAPGSELNRSVLILVRCAPQLSCLSTQGIDLTKVLKDGLTLCLKHYTDSIGNCLLTKIDPPFTSREVMCHLKGNAPAFKLTIILSAESWFGEGNWTLTVGSEQGEGNFTFNIVKQTGMTVNNSEDKTRTHLITSMCLLSITIIIAAICVLSIMKIAKQRGNGNESNGHRAAVGCSKENECHMSSNRCNADGLIYRELNFADRTPSNVIIGSLPNTQYTQISFTAGIQPLHD